MARKCPLLSVAIGIATWMASLVFAFGQTGGGEPHIMTHPSSQVVQPGESIVLSVEATGAQPLQYQWSFNGRSVEGANGFEWVIPNATPEHTGDYAVTVFNDLGIAESAIARVTVVNGVAIEFADNFDQRPTITGESGMALGDNFGATREEEEPEHGDQKGGRSVWASWTAPADGIAIFSTEGSDFDTILAIYADKRLIGDAPGSGIGGSKQPFEYLEEVTDDDDGDLLNSSYVQFLAKAGVPYEIAIDGFKGAMGNIVLTWNFYSVDKPLPVILQLPADRSVKEGDSLELSVDFQFDEEVELRWLRDGREIDGAESPTLRIPNFSISDIGLYQLRFKSESFNLLTRPVEIQINTEGRSSSIARDKLDAAVQSARTSAAALQQASSPQPPRPGPSLFTASLSAQNPIGLTRGFSGSQIFETLFATKDPDEPDHCGVPGGASYWFVLELPLAGIMEIDTLGSNYDTVLAVYTAPAPPAQYSDLVPVDCNNDISASDTASRVEFSGDPGKTYYVAVDGVGGAKGRVYLNYSLSTEFDALMQSLALRILSPHHLPSAIEINFNKIPGFQYLIEYSDTLEQYGWQNVDPANVLEGQNGVKITEPADGIKLRFYRIQLIPDPQTQPLQPF